ncbi:MAG: glycosyltransferase [Chryseotalea sp.]
MRILFISDFWIAGGAEKIFRVNYELLSKDHETKVYYAKERFTGFINPLLQYINIVQAVKVYRTILSFKPSVIHLHNYHNFLSPLVLVAIKMAKRKYNYKVVFTAHDFHICWPEPTFSDCSHNQLKPLHVFPGFKAMWRMRVSRRSALLSFFRKCLWSFYYRVLQVQNTIDTVTAPSLFLCSVIKQVWPSKKVIQIRYPIVEDFKYKTILKESLQNNKLKLVFLGRLSFEKGLQSFIQMLSSLKNEHIQFHIYGDGPIKNDLHELIKKLKLNESVRLMGYMNPDDLVKVLNNYHALVLPSIWNENAPLVLTEGAIQGLYLLSSDLGGMKELCEVCGGAFTFKPYSTESLQIALVNLYSADKESNMQKREYDTLIQQFGYQNFKKEISKVYT